MRKKSLKSLEGNLAQCLIYLTQEGGKVAINDGKGGLIRLYFPEFHRDLNEVPTYEPKQCEAFFLRKKLGPNNSESSVVTFCDACGCHALIDGYYTNKWRKKEGE